MRIQNCLALILGLFLGLSVLTAQAQDDRTFLENWLEEQLSTAGRNVTVTGFSGALSSRAHLERLTIADDRGVWLVLEDATLDWQRSAVLRGRIEIRELSAASVSVLRRPGSAPDDISPEAREPRQFRLPDLPVSINIEALDIRRVELGADILGDPLVARMNGEAQLQDGEGSARFLLERSDEKQGQLQLQGSFSNASNRLEVAFAVKEQAGGILARLARIPDRPALALTIKGAGNLPEFSGSLVLTSNGVQNMTGSFLTSAAETGGATRFQADLAGDVRPLFVARLHPFFGPTSSLQALAVRTPDGAFSIEDLQIRTRALAVGGTLALDANGIPERFDLIAELGSEQGEPVILPTAGASTRLRHARLKAHYDVSDSDNWKLDAVVQGFAHPALRLDEARLKAQGRIALTDEQVPDLKSVTAGITASVTGLHPVKPGLQDALGERLELAAALGWQDDRLSVSHLTVTGEAAEADFSGHVLGISKGLRIEGRALGSLADLGRYSGLAHVPLQTGRAKMDVQGWWQPFQGAFDSVFSLETRGVGVDGHAAYGIFEGDGKATGALRRDTDGIQITELELRSSELTARVDGKIASSASRLNATARLRNLGVLVPGINGPASLEILASQPGGVPWNILTQATGPGDANIRIAGDVSTDDAKSDIAISGNLPLGLANAFTGAGFNLQGRADLNLALKGQLEISSLTGSLHTQKARLSLPDAGLSFRDIQGSASVSGGIAELSLTAVSNQGGNVSLAGTQLLRAPFKSNLNIGLGNLALSKPPTLRTTVNGDLKLQGAPNKDAVLSGTLDLLQTEIRLVPVAGTADIPPIRHVAEPPGVRQTRLSAGLVGGGTGGAEGGAELGLDIRLRSPSRVFIRGRGLDAELGGELLLGGSSANVIPSGRFDLIRGRLDLLGKRFDLREGSAVLRGSLNPDFHLVAATDVDEFSVQVVVSGQPDMPDVRFVSSPELPEDEALALLLFGKDIASISPLQAARLANAVATLAGDGGPGVVGRLRDRFGLDDLDIVTTQNGAVAARAGKYISESAYAEITADTEGNTVIDLNLDVTPSVTLRGSASTDGDTGLGIFFEKDY